jgi:hypothetical protein
MYLFPGIKDAPAHKTHPDFFVRNFRKKNDECILTLCHSYLNPYCLGRKTAIFSSGHLNLHAKPLTGIPYRD